jgi:tetratricopeptide (TPR) repeat protein
LTSSRRFSETRSLLAAGSALLLGGCAAAPPLLPPGSPPVELAAVPFFPQTEYQCGPAALATVLVESGVATTADALVADVYVEGLRGSLQPEMLAATRRHARIPYVLEPEPAALVAELAAGRPVLVLQNLGLPRVPVWHYAVVVGIDGERVILRSGTEQRRVERAARFLRSWERGASWAFVALEPGALPASAAAAAYVRAVAGAERFLPAEAADAAVASALERWPDDELVLFAAAGRRLGERDWPAAADLYRRLLAQAPANGAARNNLANVLAEQGCYAAALAEARAALASTDSGDALHATIADTVTSVEAAAARAPATAAECR